ncbi:hypothetical protein L198_02083 [Cryptococcus wingfieldii CBS 7118]|uniref:Uncharacterized protein n=1 Tax=Cryptococcus wingfieldii CBS 7118 TaxID=1295528 RepID=A0A1E3JX30_9TREE|nr:hypothetical protein L198_02083 [Cryptococcus wingfieldii CBS 7118]ODO05390.1 hypothetical protein L198_02083 [Cryptococcus wingfieldii CBS 7118]
MNDDDQHHTYQNYPQYDGGYHHLMYEPDFGMPPYHDVPSSATHHQEGIPGSHNHDFSQYVDPQLMNASFPVGGSALNDFNEFNNLDSWGQIVPAWQLETADDGQGAHMDGPSSVTKSSAMVQGLSTSAGSIHSNIVVSEGKTHQTSPEEEEGCDDDTEDEDWSARENELDSRLKKSQVKREILPLIQSES